MSPPLESPTDTSPKAVGDVTPPCRTPRASTSAGRPPCATPSTRAPPPRKRKVVLSPEGTRVCACGAGEPVFAVSYAQANRPRWCAACPELPEGAVDVTERRAKCECGRGRRLMALPGEPPSAARWCGRCPAKPVDAVLVVAARLCECGTSNPSFGLPGTNDHRWCAQCPGKPAEAFK